MTSPAPSQNAALWLRVLGGIVWRESLRFVRQRGRFLSSLVRPLIWLVIFANGFRAVLGLSIAPPYVTYITYDVYVVPGLIGMILLFSSMQNALSMVWERESGSMRVLLTTASPRAWVLFAKLFAGVLVGIVQSLFFLAIVALMGIHLPYENLLLAVASMVPVALMLGALGLVIASTVRQLENFAAVMNFVIFPMFFASSALYPLWRIREVTPWLATICDVNPFTWGVELIRFSLYQQWHGSALAVVLAVAVVAFVIAAMRIDPLGGRG